MGTAAQQPDPGIGGQVRDRPRFQFGLLCEMMSNSLVVAGIQQKLLTAVFLVQESVLWRVINDLIQQREEESQIFQIARNGALCLDVHVMRQAAPFLIEDAGRVEE